MSHLFGAKKCATKHCPYYADDGSDICKKCLMDIAKPVVREKRRGEHDLILMLFAILVAVLLSIYHHRVVKNEQRSGTHQTGRSS